MLNSYDKSTAAIVNSVSATATIARAIALPRIPRVWAEVMSTLANSAVLPTQSHEGEELCVQINKAFKKMPYVHFILYQ